MPTPLLWHLLEVCSTRLQVRVPTLVSDDILQPQPDVRHVVVSRSLVELSNSSTKAHFTLISVCRVSLSSSLSLRSPLHLSGAPCDVVNHSFYTSLIYLLSNCSIRSCHRLCLRVTKNHLTHTHHLNRPTRIRLHAFELPLPVLQALSNIGIISSI